jgi:predicted permease
VTAFLHLVDLTAPLFLLVFVGFALARFAHWPRSASEALTRFVFSVAVPTLLFRLMSDFSRLPRVDARLLIAYFGGCALVYAIGRVLAQRLFRMEPVARSVFAMSGIFSNNVLLGVPLARVTLGEASMPAVSLIIVFHSLLLWTLVTASVEWARERALSLPALGRTMLRVVANPVVAGILAGTAFGYSGFTLPSPIDRTLALMSEAAMPLSLIALGMGLAEFRAREGWRETSVMSVVKLVLHPLAVYLIARLIALPDLETTAIVVMAALPTGANVYLMSRQFGVLIGPVASAIVATTASAAATTPIVLALLGVRALP